MHLFSFQCLFSAASKREILKASCALFTSTKEKTGLRKQGYQIRSDSLSFLLPMNGGVPQSVLQPSHSAFEGSSPSVRDARHCYVERGVIHWRICSSFVEVCREVHTEELSQTRELLSKTFDKLLEGNLRSRVASLPSSECSSPTSPCWRYPY